MEEAPYDPIDEDVNQPENTQDEKDERVGPRVLRKHWNRFVGVLNDPDQGGGYSILLSIKENIAERKEEVGGRTQKWADRVGYINYLHEVYFDKLVEIAALESDHEQQDKSVSLDERVFVDVGTVTTIEDRLQNPKVLECAVSDTLDLEKNAGSGSGWVCTEVTPSSEIFQNESGSRNSLPEGPLLTFYAPTDGELEEQGINPNHLPSRPESRGQLTNTPGWTWADALERMIRDYNRYRDRRDRCGRTLQFLELRESVLENVLYRYESIGSVGTLASGEAQRLVQSAPAEATTDYSPRPDTISELQDIVQVHADNPVAEIGDLKTEVEELGHDAERVFRKARRALGKLGIDWEDGKANSFVDGIREALGQLGEDTPGTS